MAEPSTPKYMFTKFQLQKSKQVQSQPNMVETYGMQAIQNQPKKSSVLQGPLMAES